MLMASPILMLDTGYSILDSEDQTSSIQYRLRLKGVKAHLQFLTKRRDQALTDGAAPKLKRPSDAMIAADPPHGFIRAISSSASSMLT